MLLKMPEIYNFITAKTKAVLKKIVVGVIINYTPIVGCNQIFKDLVQHKTKQI